MIVLGIDIGGSGIKGAPVDTDTGALVEERLRLATPHPACPKIIAGIVHEVVRHFDWEGPLGVTMPARVKAGVVLTAANIDDAWIGTDAGELFGESTGCDVLVINDADAAGVAEMALGSGRGCTGLALMLTFGTGIGSALFTGGVLVPNTELGHLKLHGDKAEAYAAASARKINDLSWPDWAARVQEYLRHVEFLFAPDLIILGGGVSRPKRARKYLDLLSTKADLKLAELQNEAGIVGAASAAWQAATKKRY